MKDKFNRIKQFVNEHPAFVVYGTGVAVGSVATFYCLKKYPFPVLPNGVEVEIQDTAEAFAADFAEKGHAVIHCDPSGFELILTASK
jgi:hypothetical protein